MQNSQDVGSTFARSWELLRNNWILIVPGLVIGIALAIILGIMALVALASLALSSLIMSAVALLAVVVTIAFTTGMAAAAWQTGTASLSDGSKAFTAEGGSIFVAILLVAVAGILAVILAIPTLFISLVLFALCVLYVFAGVVVGGNTGPAALAESARISFKNWPTSLALLVLLALVSWISTIIGHALAYIPFLGTLLGYVLQQAVSAYVALVVVGEYIKLKGTIEPATVPPSAT